MKIAFLGDLVLDCRAIVDDSLRTMLGSCDFVLANLEGAVLRLGENKPFKSYGSVVFNDPDALASLLADINITHVSLYNNHLFDYGVAGIDFTLQFLSDKDIDILGRRTTLELADERISVVNCGLPEFFGISPQAAKFGFGVNEMLLRDDLGETIPGSIVLAHFGVEATPGLSRYELAWFNKMATENARLVVRHHPHCVQQPFKVDAVPCFPSIGDFAFNFGRKRSSSGLVLFYDTDFCTTQVADVICKDGRVSCTEQRSADFAEHPRVWDLKEKQLITERYLREYREDPVGNIKKALKYGLGLQDPRHSLVMSSAHYIQTLVMGELLEEDSCNPG